jgi:HlyD family secretion protein
MSRFYTALMKTWSAILLTVILAQGCSHGPPALVTVTVVRDSISRTVTASGTLAAQDTVLVGSQVSGTIETLYVDYNSRVHRGQVLARLDPSSFQAALDQANATLSQVYAQRSAAVSSASSAAYSSSAAQETAQSQREQIAAADEAVRKARSGLDLAMLTAYRDTTLFRQGYVARNVVDADITNVASERAAFVAAQTESKSARLMSAASMYQAGSTAAQAVGASASQRASDAVVRAARAAVRQAQINLDHATITSPLDGTVIERNVSVGQTVAAALQAPTLFTIAKDLRKMELDVAVGEPDVGSVQAGQTVAFSVLAYPGRTFTTTVSQVRQNPTVVNNVTTYDSVAYPTNRDGALRPGMTANVRVTVANYPGALVVPLPAMQWRPSAAVTKQYTVVAPAYSGEGIKTSRSAWGATNSSVEFAVSVGGEGRVYVLDGRELRGVRVMILAIDGTRVGVSPVAGRLADGDPLVVDEGSATNAVATSLP